MKKTVDRTNRHEILLPLQHHQRPGAPPLGAMLKTKARLDLSAQGIAATE